MALRIEALDLSYGASRCLRGVSLEAEPGRITCVMGRNGVGKSSLMRAIIGLERVQSGRILWEGRDVAGMAPAERARISEEHTSELQSRQYLVCRLLLEK